MQKEEDNNEIINLDEVDSSDYIWILLKSLVLKHEYNKAENILFEVFHNDIICKKGNSNSNSPFFIG